MINKSKGYLSPLVLIDMPDIEFKLIKNTYIFSDFRCLEPTIYMEMLSNPDIVTEDYLQRLHNYDCLEDIFKIGEHYLLVTRLNKKYNYEYLCFKKGNYSWYTPEAKNIIINYLANNVQRRALYMVDKMKSIFGRDPMLKQYYEKALDVSLKEDSELGSRMLDEEETFLSTEYGNFRKIERTVNT